MLKKILFILFVAGNHVAAMSALEEKNPQSAYLSTNQTNPLSPAERSYLFPNQSTTMEVFMAIGAIGIGINFGRFTTSHLLSTRTNPAIKTALFIILSSIGGLVMAPDQIELATKFYNNWRHKN